MELPVLSYLSGGFVDALVPLAFLGALIFAVLLTRAWRAQRALEQRFKAVLDIEAERARIATEVDALAKDSSRLKDEVAVLNAEKRILDEEGFLRSYAFYKPVYAFSHSDQYERRLEQIRENQKEMLKDETAATCTVEWKVNGSRAEGKKQIKQTLKLMLRAFNGECDAAVAKVNYKNVKAMESRIEKSADLINALAKVQQCSISSSYINLKLDELRLAHEYQEKLQDEKDEQKRIREQMREEEVARREFERAKLDAEREERRYAEALRKAREEVLQAKGAAQEKLLAKMAELEQRLADVQDKARAISQAQLTKAGHVYVISNIGSFGENVFKIGMTRRLVPQDRVDELGDASVPFEFDVHAIISTQDAPGLENALHKRFDEKRLNLVNTRKEFFRASLDEIAAVVKECHGEFAFTKIAEAAEYRKSLAILEERSRVNATAVNGAPATAAA